MTKKLLGSFLLKAGSLFLLACCTSTSFAQLGATPASSFRLPEGFQVDLLYEVPLKQQGSWVCLCVDLQGRLIASDQYGKLYRISGLDSAANLKVEALNIEIEGAQGLLHTKDGLYIDVNAKKGSGLYRAQDLDKDDQFEKIEQLIELNGGAEHGPHAIIEGPNGRLYLAAGNQTDLPKNVSRSLVPKHWSEDHLLGRMPDARGFMKDRLAPGGFILSLNPDGSDIEIVSTGFRNQYDIAFNGHGDLFTYDADMEWDIGTPWYRPTRVNHVISGAEFGWRNGTGKWPEYYADSFGAVVNIGPGSPTGIVFGKGAKFPAKYQRSLFISDWSYGVVYRVEMQPSGASYTGTFEPFMSAAPLPVTDLVVHPQDGSMYFTIGGRQVQSALYRVRYTGKESTDAASDVDTPEAQQARTLRRSLEQYHAKPDAAVIPLAIQQLGNKDRSIRTAARIALELLPVAQWQQSLTSLKSPQAIITGAVALARSSKNKEQDQVQIQKSLLRLDWNQLSREEKLEFLRAYQLSFTRLGSGSPELRQQMIAQLNERFPVSDEDTLVNRELATLLIYLDAPGIVERCVGRMASASSVDEQIQYAISLREAKSWTDASRKTYFQWFIDMSSARGGASFGGFIENIRQAAIKQLSDDQKLALGALVEKLPEPKDPLADLKPRAMVQEWKVDDLIAALDAKKNGYQYERGKQMFAVALCYKCHRFAGQGGIQGPDLTGAGGRFNHRDLLAAIIEPNKEISDQYQATQFVTDDGDVVVGRVANLKGDTLQVMTNMLDPGNFKSVKRDSITSSKPSPNSMMPAGLLNTLSKDEVLDLMAYIKSAGNPKSPLFEKK